jgi:polyisoprenoid-binding protein YceI
MFKKLALVSVLALVACNNDPAKGKSQAAVADPAAAPVVTGVKYAFDQSSSKVEFVGAKVTGKHDGSFGTFQGTIQLVSNDPLKSQVTVEVDTASLTSDNPKLTGHLKSADFFDVAKYPKARFTSTAIKAGGDNGATHTVTGNLELHGVTKSITFPATIRLVGDDAVHVDSEFAIRRKDFGLVYPGMPNDLIKEEVLLKLAVRAKKSPNT